MQWEHYLTRPFNLFGASFWHEWYISPVPTKVIGANMPDAIFVEQKRGVVRCYREAKQIQKFVGNIRRIAEQQPKKLERFLQYGIILNSVALKKLRTHNHWASFREGISFAVEHALYASTIPYFAGRYVEKNTKNFKLINTLRRLSYYPLVLKRIICPLAIRILEQKWIHHADKVYSRLTVQEILEDSPQKIINKLKLRTSKRRFIYRNIHGHESITYVSSTGKYIRSLEKVQRNTSKKLHGQIAFPGFVRGTARVIFNSDKKHTLFNAGDILISINSNPSLLPIIKKCSAIVTDEGGVTCHAAIIARELKIPCVIGTQKATSRIRNGDYIEVDARRGFVRKITRNS